MQNTATTTSTTPIAAPAMVTGLKAGGDSSPVGLVVPVVEDNVSVVDVEVVPVVEGDGRILDSRGAGTEGTIHEGCVIRIVSIDTIVRTIHELAPVDAQAPSVSEISPYVGSVTVVSTTATLSQVSVEIPM